MNADDLDARIRAMLRDAVDAAPPAPDLPTSDEPRAATARAPRWAWAGIGIAAAVAATAVLVLTARGDDGSTVVAPTSVETTAAATSTVDPGALPWPEGVAVIVASERGIERVTAEGGSAVVTRLLSGVKVERAFELEDGAIVYQTYPDGVVRVLGRDDDPPLATAVSLQDAAAPRGDLRLVYRTPSDDPASAGRVWAWFQPDGPLAAELPGGFGVSYRRFSIVDQRTVWASTLDDTGQRSAFTFSFGDGEQLAPGFEQPYFVIGDGAGTYVGLTASGTIERTGVVSGSVGGIADPQTVIEMDTRGDWLTLQREDGSTALVDLTQGATYELPVAGGGGNISVSRKDHAPSKGVPTTTPSTLPAIESTTAVPTTLPGSVNEGQPYPSCLTVTAPSADVQLGTGLYSVEPLPEEQIEVAGKPAVLQELGGSYGVVLRHPDWCTEYGMSTSTMSKTEFLDWLSGVQVVETLPPDMPPTLLRSRYGLSVVGPYGSRVVHRGPVDQALLLADGSVVFHGSELADFQLWDAATGRSEPIWSAVSWIALPVLHDAYRDSFVFSVGKVMYWYDHDQTWTLGAATGRVSITEFGAVSSQTSDPGAVSPNGELSAFVEDFGVVGVDSSTGPEFRSSNSDVQVTDLDLHDAGWLTISEIPPGDSPVRVRLVNLSTGRAIVFDGAEGAHLG